MLGQDWLHSRWIFSTAAVRNLSHLLLVLRRACRRPRVASTASIGAGARSTRPARRVPLHALEERISGRRGLSPASSAPKSSAPKSSSQVFSSQVFKVASSGRLLRGKRSSGPDAKEGDGQNMRRGRTQIRVGRLFAIAGRKGEGTMSKRTSPSSASQPPEAEQRLSMARSATRKGVVALAPRSRRLPCARPHSRATAGARPHDAEQRS